MRSYELHGLRKSKEYGVWHQMKNRCYNRNTKKFALYGARGIAVCDRWRKSFVAFYEDMGPRPSAQHTLERKDNDGPYSPGNCRWATQREQQSNRRDNHLLTHEGVTKTMSEWNRHLNFPIGLICQRLRVLKWDVAKALTTPLKQSVTR